MTLPAPMRYISTRGGVPPHTFGEAVAAGLAPDGGLFVPATMPDLAGMLPAWRDCDYEKLAESFLQQFAADIPPAELRGMVRASYAGWDRPERAPLRRLADDLWVLELFHGPTLAFKDFALQLLGQLYERQVRLSGRPIVVLGATSGDTGSAAIQGLIGHKGVRIFILYPRGRVAPLQERQMACTGADNVFPIAIPGTFDDAQRIVKDLFADRALVGRLGLSAVNSINLARILAQSVYYLWARLRLDAAGVGEAEFVVPTGNFGNVLSGWMLGRMGVPGLRFCVATNCNDILHRFFSTGEYIASGAVEPSLAPSMDIQVASNFERYVHFLENGDAARVRAVMTDAAAGRGYRSKHPALGAVRSARLDDAGIRQVTREVFEKYGYVVDPHTACGFAAPSAGVPRVILATASPAKFPETVAEATGRTPRHPTLDALLGREIVRHEVAADVAAVRAFIEARA